MLSSEKRKIRDFENLITKEGDSHVLSKFSGRFKGVNFFETYGQDKNKFDNRLCCRIFRLDNGIVNVITPVAWSVVILVIVIIGCVLLWGGDKAKEKVKSHITAIVVGCILIAGATTIANWWTGTLTANFK